MAVQAPWSTSFVVTHPTNGVTLPEGAICLCQVDLKDFLLKSRIRYVGGETGLEGKVNDEVIALIREVGPDELPTTDLTSVPQPLRWLVSQYGSHTPAALIHDRLIGKDSPVEGVTDVDADRYFRFMLRDLGVRLLRRWLMWTAVALRTRWKAGGVKSASVFIWGVASLGGMSLFVVAVTSQNWQLLLVAVAAPFLFGFLWWRQYGAGLVAAIAAPWVLPPTIFGAIGFYVYALFEWFIGKFVGSDTRPVEPLRYKSF